MEKLVSVLIPIYGVEKYIERCATSLFNQTYDNCEFVFVNDCTKDNSITILNEVISRYPALHSRIHVISHEVNQGLGGARLTGIKNAHGYYLSFVDSDDYVEPDYIKKMVATADSTHTDLVVSSNALLNNEVEKVDILTYLKEKCCRRCPARIWGSLQKKEIFDSHEIYPILGIDHAEDYHVMCKYISECKSIILMKEELYHYNTDNDQSYTKNYTEKSILSIYNSLVSTSAYLLKKDKKLYKDIVYFANLEFIRWVLENVPDNSLKDMFISRFKSYNIPLWAKTGLFSLQYLPAFISKVILRITYTFI